MSELPENDGRGADITKALQHALARHGYGFQYAVIRRIGDLWQASNSKWVFEASEFPVGSGAGGTHIDFILSRRRGSWDEVLPPDSTRSYIVAECKRVDPAVGRWCFARAPYVSRRNGARFVAEHSRFNVEPRMFLSSGVILRSLDRRLFTPYQIGLELRSDGTGDSTGKSMDAAFSQVLRGLNGFVEQLPRIIAVGPRAAITVPVLFTTAELLTTEADLSLAAIETGKIDLSDFPATPKLWVPVQCNQSLSLRHNHMGSTRPTELGDILQFEFARTVIVVNSGGIDDFFAEFNPDLDTLRET